MTKLPDDDTLRGFFREGRTDKQIAAAYGCTISAVNLRFSKMGLSRKPWSNTATAIIEAAWPSSDFTRSRFTASNSARNLWVFLRWRLGDPTLTPDQQRRVRNFTARMEREGNILVMDWSREGHPWVFLPREPSDGRLVVRWPEGRELPKGPHLEALMLPPVTAEPQEAMELDAR